MKKRMVKGCDEWWVEIFKEGDFISNGGADGSRVVDSPPIILYTADEEPIFRKVGF